MKILLFVLVFFIPICICADPLYDDNTKKVYQKAKELNIDLLKMPNEDVLVYGKVIQVLSDGILVMNGEEGNIYFFETDDDTICDGDRFMQRGVDSGRYVYQTPINTTKVVRKYVYPEKVATPKTVAELLKEISDLEEFNRKIKQKEIFEEEKKKDPEYVKRLAIEEQNAREEKQKIFEQKEIQRKKDLLKQVMKEVSEKRGE